MAHVSAKQRRRFLRAAWVTAAWMLTAACAPLGSSAAAQDQSTPAATSPASQEAPRPYSYVALGDSWPNGAHCGFCETFVGRYADLLNRRLERQVVLTNLTENGGTSASMLTALRSDDHVRDAVAKADIIVIETGLNDLDDTGALDKVAAGTCGGRDDSDCLRAMGRLWRTNFEAIAAEIDQLRGGEPTALRLVTSQNIFVSDPSIIDDYGLPKDFGLTGGKLLTQQLRDAQCATAGRHHGQCVDVGLLFNGPHGDKPRDENTERSHTQVARALLRTGLRELR